MTSRGFLLPGMEVRPQKIITGKSNCKEDVISESKSTFVFVKNCENIEVNVQGKAGKVVCENGKNVTLQINDRLIGGTLELIRSDEVYIKLGDNAEIAIIQIDKSSKVNVEISRKDQIKSIYFCDSKDIKVKLSKHISEESSTIAPVEYFAVDTSLEEEVYDDLIPQWVAYWNTSSESASFVTERVVREGIYPSRDQMKTVAQVKDDQALNRLNP